MAVRCWGWLGGWWFAVRVVAVIGVGTTAKAQWDARDLWGSLGGSRAASSAAETAGEASAPWQQPPRARITGATAVPDSSVPACAPFCPSPAVSPGSPMVGEAPAWNPAIVSRPGVAGSVVPSAPISAAVATPYAGANPSGAGLASPELPSTTAAPSAYSPAAYYSAATYEPGAWQPPGGASANLLPSSPPSSVAAEFGAAGSAASGLPDPATAGPLLSDGIGGAGAAPSGGWSTGGGPWATGVDVWHWQVLPDGLLFKSYMAGGRESRFATRWIYVRGEGWLWDSALGGRVGILRYGTDNPTWPEGWQIDVEGAAFPRLDPEFHRDLVSCDFRFGVPLTWRRGAWEWKFGYYHLSSHLGDEYMLVNTRPRINYSRDCLVLGVGWHPWPDTRLYAEADYGFYLDGGAKPWHFQFGAEYSPIKYTGFRGAPFLAVAGHLREEDEFGGNFTAQAGWQWRGATGHVFRVGAHYLNGQSDEYQFHTEHEDQIGIGLWYDY